MCTRTSADHAHLRASSDALVRCLTGYSHPLSTDALEPRGCDSRSIDCRCCAARVVALAELVRPVAPSLVLVEGATGLPRLVSTLAACARCAVLGWAALEAVGCAVVRESRARPVREAAAFVC